MKLHMIAGGLMLGLAAPALAQLGTTAMTRADFQAHDKAQFAAADANHDGVITKDELTAMIAKAMGSAPPPQMIDQIFSHMDANGDGKATEAEVSAMSMARFDQMDANHDGVLTPEEVAAARAAMQGQQQKSQ